MDDPQVLPLTKKKGKDKEKYTQKSHTPTFITHSTEIWVDPTQPVWTIRRMDRSPAPARNQMIPQASTPLRTPIAVVSNLQYFMLDRKGFYTGYVCNTLSELSQQTDSQFSPFRH